MQNLFMIQNVLISNNIFWIPSLMNICTYILFILHLHLQTKYLYSIIFMIFVCLMTLDYMIESSLSFWFLNLPHLFGS